jgi:alanine-glyoxylate transaminase / serine-glyoxylate transaminase / serine-pyruvate transaminase
MPTDTLAQVLQVMRETQQYGFERVCAEQQELGTKARALLVRRGFPSVAAEGFQAPGVVVSYTDDPEIQSARRFAEFGVQAAAGVPLQCDEPADFSSFRLGLFGLDKLHNIERTLANLDRALTRLAQSKAA